MWHLPTHYVQVDNLHGTGNVMIALDVKGTPTFRCSQDVAFDYLHHDEQNQALAASADAVLFTTLGQRSAFSRHAVQQFLHAASRAIKIFDVNWLPPPNELRTLLQQCLSFTHILKANEAGMNAVRLALRREGDRMTRFVDYLFKKFSLKLIAVTRGGGGCEIFDGQQAFKVSGLPVRVVDTTGAGDAFAAGLTHKYLRGAPLQDTAEFANLLGAFVSTQLGATPAFSPALLESFSEDIS
jgi:fructokinase